MLHAHHSAADCFDVVRDQKDHVWLMDFAPYGARWTEELAFEWSELDDLCEARRELHNGDSDSADAESADEMVDDVEFRYVSEDTGIQPSRRNNYGIPKDVVDVYAGSPETHGTTTGPDAAGGSCTLDDLLFRQLRDRSERSDREAGEEEH